MTQNLVPYNEWQLLRNLNLKNKEGLDLRDNQITEIKGLENLTKLEYLALSRNQISEIKGLERLKELKSLNLGNNKIDPNDPRIKELKANGVFVRV